MTFEAADPVSQAELTARLGDPKLDRAGVDRLREIITESGALARTERRITELASTAQAALSNVSLDPAATEALTALATAATTRTG